MGRQSSITTGRQTRKRVPRSSHGSWTPAPDRADPVEILERQGANRVPELLPVRYARMAATRFGFLRGAPAVLAADLAAAPHTGLTVQLCGDAHLSNFGVFASPERALLFDLNDFDETLPGPFEWDVKRLAASIAVAAAANEESEATAHAAARDSARAYRLAIRRLADRGELDVWYERVDTADLLPQVRKSGYRRRVEANLAKARGRTSLQALAKLTEPGKGGTPRIIHDPPLLEPLDRATFTNVRQILDDYRATLPEERAQLLDRFEVLDAARKVVGVGSVGTRCYIVLLRGRTTGEPLFLQVKEAERSVLEAHLAPARHRHQGHRVVAGQRLLQAAGDSFLGWSTGPGGREFYWRQLRDMKGSAVIEGMPGDLLLRYAALCGQTLAHGHARSGDRVAIAAYLGSGDSFDRAIADFALRYAEQTRSDHAALTTAIATGRITAAPG
ncbi:DUF2252 domain-containing protein [Kitasatospora sp. NBC_01287]|uniref:DUF2252 domain-containing protein n=1 Tax=Kitasatospora sp. NBC_01287 TaxID=2903573 RepID=UPI0022526EF6|nr:DUF2252 domain-containing protein [Kitasatospora sp. NBC_01287]MCX4744152.1 DUF2252 domain-containing protein [Kitasatospora sp. NBC_01287]